MRSHRASAILIGLCGWIAAPPSAAGQILDASWSGREQAAIAFKASLEKERRPPDWPGAVRELEKCLELSPEPSWEASIQDGSGRWRRHYLPYFYLGRAHWNAGDCEQAVASLSRSLAAGEVCRSKQGEVREIEKLLQKCEQRGTGPDRPAKELVREECSRVATAEQPDSGGGLMLADRTDGPGWPIFEPPGAAGLLCTALPGAFDRPTAGG